MRHRAFFNGPDWVTGFTIKDERHTLFCRLDRNWGFLAINGYVGENRDIRQVIIPDRVVNGLKMPDPLACFDVESNRAGAKQVVAWSEATVIINGWGICWDINDAAV